MTSHNSSISHLVKTLVGLFLLLALSVWAAQWHLGNFNMLIAMLIAAAKALLVGYFFMELRLASPLTRLFAVSGLLWFLIMVMLTLSDFMTRGM